MAKYLVGGLVAYLGSSLHRADVAGAGNKAHWRGRQHEPAMVPGVGLICAQGSAFAGVRDRLAIGIHGRIDNLPEIAANLGTEPTDHLGILARLYREDHDGFAARIVGDFALIVIDPDRRSLLAVRDWIGMRPLFWMRNEDGVSVASEIKQVLSLLDRPLRPAMAPLEAFAANEELDLTTTFVEDVQAVPPSGQLLATPDGRSRIWRRDLRFHPVKIGFQEAAEEIRRRLEIAVARRLSKETRPGAMLSGGVDSPAVTAVAALLGRTGIVPRLRHCYTMSFPEIPECDESKSASLIAKSCSVNWKPVVIKVSDYRAWPARALELHDGPVFPGACGASLMMEAAQQDGIDTLLSGIGGDEFADQTGDELRMCLLRREWLAAAEWIRAGGVRGLKRNFAETARTFLGGVLKRQRAECVFEATASWFWTRYVIEILEREGARRGIVVESPLLDFELASLLAGLPPSVRSSPPLTKNALREAVKGLVPDEVRLNPYVVGYNAVVFKTLGFPPENESLHRFIYREYASFWRRALTKADTE